MGKNSNCPVVLYTAPDGTTQLDVKLENETVWLSVSQMSALFDEAYVTIGDDCFIGPNVSIYTPVIVPIHKNETLVRNGRSR